MDRHSYKDTQVFHILIIFSLEAKLLGRPAGIQEARITFCIFC